MQSRIRFAVFLSSLAALACMPFAACGSGGTTTQGFAQLLIGPSGAHAAALNVQLDVPAGAFATEHTVAILPQVDPPPIEQPQTCNVEYYGGITCIGPLGLALAVPGHVQCCYDPSQLPKGASEQDLVLLEWNEALGVMQVSQDAVQNLATHCFDDFAYDFLGHVAVGLCLGEGPQGEFEYVFLGEPQLVLKDEAQLQVGGGSLHQVDLDLALPTTYLDGTDGARDYLPSRDGSRVLYTLSNIKYDDLYTVDTALPPPFVSRQLAQGFDWFPGDATFGWLGDQDFIYFHRPTDQPSDLVAPLGGGNPANAFAVTPGGTSAPADLEYRNTDTYVFDVRVSPDKQYVLVRWYEYSKGIFEHVDVLDATEGGFGNVIATDLPIPMDLFDATDTPRWLPDSSGLYYREFDGVTVTRIDPDGSNPSTLYELFQSNRYLKDFVVATPFAAQPLRGAMVCADTSFQPMGEVTPPSSGYDVYATEELPGDTDYAEMDLQGFYSVVEMVPLNGDGIQQPLVLVQFSDESIEEVGVLGALPLPSPLTGQTLVFSSAAPSLQEVIPTEIRNVDVARTGPNEGEILVWIPTIPPNDTNPVVYSTPGIYHLDPDATNPVLVTPAGFDVFGPPRWLRSWRFAPGHEFSPRVR